MTIFKHILIPVDFSVHSSEAIQLGSQIAARFQGSVTLLHVHELFPYGLAAEYDMYAPDLRERLLAEIGKDLAAAKRRAETAGAPDVVTKIAEGYPSADITEYAAKGGYDLIVMGTHGHRGIKHALLGSVAERVVRTAPCAVLTVRAPQEPASAASKQVVPNGPDAPLQRSGR